MKRLLSLWMALLLLIGMFPASAFAAELDTPESAAAEPTQNAEPTQEEENIADEEEALPEDDVSDEAEQTEETEDAQSAEEEVLSEDSETPDELPVEDDAQPGEPEPADTEEEPTSEDDPQEESKPVAPSASGSDVAYPVTGGNIYFAPETGAITGCDYDVTVANIPASINGVAVTSIDDYTFYRHSGLTSITIPASVTSIGMYAFNQCSSLSNITIPASVTNIGLAVFEGCSSLNSAGPIGGGYDCEFGWINSIPSGVFLDCNGLTSIKIPDGMTSIGDSAFDGCSSLSSITIPNSVTSIGSDAFVSCSALTSVTIPGTSSIGDHAFSYCAISKVTITGVGAMTDFQYSDSDSINYYQNTPWYTGSLHSGNDFTVTIEEGLTSIGDLAFYDCSSLSNLKIPSSVTSIGDWAFYDCSSLTSIEVLDGLTSIGNMAFYDCSSLTSIEVLDGLTSIGDGAFDGCSSLSSIEIPASVISIGVSAFRDCRSLSSNIEIPDGVTSIGDYAFYGCSSLPSLTLPVSLASIGDYAFYCCGLISIEIPASVISIGKKAFWACGSLISIEFLANVTSIGEEAFFWCRSLTSITIPASVTSIGDRAFQNCSSLSSVTIGNGVTSIGENAFYSCSSLTYVYYPGSEEEWKNINVGSGNSNLTSATIHYYSIMPTNPDAFTDQISFGTWKDKNYIGCSFAIEARIPNAADLTEDDIQWTISNEGIFEFEFGYFGNSLTGSDTKYVILYAVGRKKGETTITITLSDGRTDSCTISCIGTKPEEPEYEYHYHYHEPQRNEGYEIIQFYCDEWEEKFNNQYVKAVKKVLTAYAESDEGQREQTIENMAQEMQKHDSTSSSKYLTYAELPSSSWEKYAYRALATYLFDNTCQKLELGETLNEASIITSVINSLKSSTKSYEYGDIVMDVDVFQFSGARTGQITAYKKSKPSTRYTIGVTSTQEECKSAIKDLYEQLGNLENAATYNLYMSVCQDILGESLSSFTDAWLDKKLTKLLPKLDPLGIGNLYHALKSCHEYYEFIKRILYSDPEAAMELLDSLADVEIQETTITDRAVSKAAGVLDKAGRALQTMYIDYVNGDLNENAFEKFFRLTFSCPVEISIWNSYGDMVGHVSEDDIWYIDSISIEEVGDAKIIESYTGDLLSFSVSGTDYGQLSCSVEEYGDASRTIGRANFYDIALTPDTNLFMTLPETLDGDTGTMSISSSTEGYIKADEYIPADQDGTVEISCSVKNNDGSAANNAVLGTGIYVRGDAVALTASPISGYRFAGWYEDDVLVYCNPVYEFAAKDPVTLTAVFVKNQSDNDVITAFITTSDNRTVEIYDPNDLLANGAVVFASEFQDGKMQKVTCGELAAGSDTVTFPEALKPGWSLFFLSLDGYVPLYDKLIL